mmetsp:Transcript_4865/g.20673  ORF Transcript_4865/g.20673 Transcript_4865/m.20673 type:complete len:238 (+) Transcript_4865:929-1642(+)
MPLGRYQPHAPERDGAHRQRIATGAPFTLCATRRAHVALVRTRRVGGGARGDHRGHGDPPRGGVRADHPVPGHLGVHDGRARDGGQGDGAGVHAPGQVAAEAVLPVLLLGAGRLPGAGTKSDGQRRLAAPGVPRGVVPRRHGRGRAVHPRAFSFRRRGVVQRRHPVGDGRRDSAAGRGDARRPQRRQGGDGAQGARAAGGRARRGRGRRRGALHAHAHVQELGRRERSQVTRETRYN